jgi:hypothetical protein
MCMYHFCNADVIDSDWMNFYLCSGLEWNHADYYCSHLLACCTWSGWWTVMIVEQLVGWMFGRGNRSNLRKPAPVTLCPPQSPYDLTLDWTWAPEGGKLATNRLSYGAAWLDDRLQWTARDMKGTGFAPNFRNSPSKCVKVWQDIRCLDCGSSCLSLIGVLYLVRQGNLMVCHSVLIYKPWSFLPERWVLRT